MERLKNIVDINLSLFAEEMRVKLAQDLQVKEMSKTSNGVPETEDALGKKIAVNLSNDTLSLFFSESRPKIISQNVLVTKSIESIRKTIASFSGESINIRDKDGKNIATVPKSTLFAILDSEPFKDFVQASFSGISQESMKNGDFMKNILNIADEIKKNPL